MSLALLQLFRLTIPAGATMSNTAMFTASTAREFFGDWASKRKLTSVAVVHNDSPAADADSRYLVVYEVAFQPSDPEMAQLEFWITDTGEIGVGFERWHRIAERLGARTCKVGFVGGHEPRALSAQAVMAILECVARGSLSVTPRMLPVIGLVGATIQSPESAFLGQHGYDATGWLCDAKEASKSSLRFKPWK